MTVAKNDEASEWWIWNCLRDMQREGRENHAVGECSRNKFILVHGHRPRLGHVFLRNQFCILMMQSSCYILDYFWDEFLSLENMSPIYDVWGGDTRVPRYCCRTAWITYVYVNRYATLQLNRDGSIEKEISTILKWTQPPLNSVTRASFKLKTKVEREI